MMDRSLEIVVFFLLEYFFKRADVLLCLRYNNSRRSNISTNINWWNIDGICSINILYFSLI